MQHTIENMHLLSQMAFGFFPNDKHMHLTYGVAFHCMPLASYRTQV